MARPRRGTLKRRPTKQGISYGVAFTYGGEGFYEHFGGEWEGWDEERAAEEQRFLMEKVNRGEWKRAKIDPQRGLATAAWNGAPAPRNRNDVPGRVDAISDRPRRARVPPRATVRARPQTTSARAFSRRSVTGPTSSWRPGVS
jgi:hypothetical protein